MLILLATLVIVVLFCIGLFANPRGEDRGSGDLFASVIEGAVIGIVISLLSVYCQNRVEKGSLSYFLYALFGWTGCSGFIVFPVFKTIRRSVKNQAIQAERARVAQVHQENERENQALREAERAKEAEKQRAEEEAERPIREIEWIVENLHFIRNFQDIGRKSNEFHTTTTTSCEISGRVQVLREAYYSSGDAGSHSSHTYRIKSIRTGDIVHEWEKSFSTFIRQEDHKYSEGRQRKLYIEGPWSEAFKGLKEEILEAQKRKAEEERAAVLEAVRKRKDDEAARLKRIKEDS